MVLATVLGQFEYSSNIAILSYNCGRSRPSVYDLSTKEHWVCECCCCHTKISWPTRRSESLRGFNRGEGSQTKGISIEASLGIRGAEESEKWMNNEQLLHFLKEFFESRSLREQRDKGAELWRRRRVFSILEYQNFVIVP